MKNNNIITISDKDIIRFARLYSSLDRYENVSFSYLLRKDFQMCDMYLVQRVAHKLSGYKTLPTINKRLKQFYKWHKKHGKRSDIEEMFNNYDCVTGGFVKQ